MKKIFLILNFSFLFLCTGMFAQTLIDAELQRIANGALVEQLSHCPEGEIRYAAVAVQEVATGNVIVNASLLYKSGEFVTGPNSTFSFPSPLGRAVLYLSMMPEANPYMVVNTHNGIYQDAEGITITDHNAHRGGYGEIDLLRSFTHNSDVGCLLCAEHVFKKDMKKYACQINRSAILFGGRTAENYENQWDSRSMLGYNSPYNLLQVCCWINAVAGGRMVIRLNSGDPTEEYDKILNQEGLLCLRSAMREHIIHGLGRPMNNSEVPVAGMTNLSPKNVEGFRTQFAGGFFPYQEDLNDIRPQYSIAVVIQRRWQNGHTSAAAVARKIIDFIYIRSLLKNIANENTDSKSKSDIEYVPHRAEK